MEVEGERGGKKEEKSKSEGEWNSSVYFDPGTKYIWGLALDGNGNLCVARGDHGQIFRVAANGDHSLFFKSDEPHIRVLAFDGQGNLITGSDGSGLIYRISAKGEGFVLYSAPKREITSLALDSAGNIYVAAAGEKHSGGGPPSLSLPPSAPNPTPAPSGGGSAGIPPPESTVTLNNSSTADPVRSEIYKIAADSSPAQLLRSRH